MNPRRKPSCDAYRPSTGPRSTTRFSRPWVKRFRAGLHENPSSIELEGHGREDLFEGIDLTRTVGWFTTIFPVRLEARTSDPGAALVETKERLRQVPHRGLSYGLLRYLGSKEPRTLLDAHAQPDLVFNYLGQFDHVVAGSSLFRFAPESPGPWHSPRARRRHALEVLTLVAGRPARGALRLQRDAASS